MGNEDFKPTVWRTARALSNEKRLRLFHEVWMSKGDLSVSALAEKVGLSVSTASDYLRALNARGLISVGRDKSYVFYANGRDRSLRDAQTLQDAFSKVFASENLPKTGRKACCLCYGRMPISAVLQSSAALHQRRGLPFVKSPQGRTSRA